LKEAEVKLEEKAEDLKRLLLNYKASWRRLSLGGKNPKKMRQLPSAQN
jgi:hypothetical protein